MFEAVLVGRARAQWEALPPTERADLDRVISEIEHDPWIDNARKLPFLVPPVVLSLYDDGRWRISYRVVDDRFVEIYAISRRGSVEPR